MSEIAEPTLLDCAAAFRRVRASNEALLADAGDPELHARLYSRWSSLRERYEDANGVMSADEFLFCLGLEGR